MLSGPVLELVGLRMNVQLLAVSGTAFGADGLP